MIVVNVGSKNPVKILAVEDALRNYPDLNPFSINSYDVPSDVSKQPKSIEEIVRGAKNRARKSFISCDYSFGLESGLMKIPETKTGYMDVGVCAIHDSKNNYHLGISCAFEIPVEVARLVFEEGLDLSEASHRTGLTQNENIGSAEGIIGILTNGNVTRKDYTIQAIHMALIKIRNPGLYR